MKFALPPKYVGEILQKLEGAGYHAYLVGGCVRDMLMQKRPADWDVCTDARPEEVMALFSRSEPSGIRHGTVTVLRGGGRVEVTTFRSEGAYADHRRPDSVSFVSDLKEDLSRRDFTINAMALSRTGRLIDPFGGREDLKRRLIRCVGEPGRRFGEDALRMFRALRFSARLGFDLEAGTAAAIPENAPLAAYLARERVRDELEKILLSPHPELFGLAAEYGLLEGYVSAAPAPALGSLRKLPKKKRLRWAGLCALLLREGSIDGAESFLSSLRLDGASIRCCSIGAELALRGADSDTVCRKLILARYGEETALCCAAATQALGRSGSLRAMRAVIDSGECRSLRQLAVRGDDLIPLGLAGRALGDALWTLLEHVIRRPADNDRETLMKIAKKLADKAQ